MSDIKSDFREWLINNGISERTSTGRLGAVYEYIRLLNQVCDFIYKKHDTEQWQQLSVDIYPILGFHLLCKNGEIVINKNNIAHIDNFLFHFLYNMSPYQDNLNSYLSIVMQNEKTEKISFNYSLLQDLLPSIIDEQIICKFLISKFQQQKHRTVLSKFYWSAVFGNGIIGLFVIQPYQCKKAPQKVPFQKWCR